MKMSTLMGSILLIIGIYLALLLLVAWFQTSMIFFPGKLAQDYQFDPSLGSQEVFLKTGDGESINGLLFGSGKDSAKVFLYFHGNAGDLASWQYVYSPFMAIGHDFFIIDYRGYGKSTGKITETGLYADGQAAYDHLIQQGYKPSDIIIYGRSIGCGVAVEIARNNANYSLILESPNTSLPDIASSIAPFLLPRLLLRFDFNNLEKINSINCPLLVIHGTKDQTIPIRFGKRLFEHFEGNKEFLSIEGGGHNNLSEFGEFGEGIRRFVGNR